MNLAMYADSEQIPKNWPTAKCYRFLYKYYK